MQFFIWEGKVVFHLKVKNFGKIEYADISLSNFVVFVGNNNSGKTMMMQLIYGIRDELMHLSVPAMGIDHSNLGDQYLIRIADTWFKEVEIYVNTYLSEHKNQIIQNIFGVSVPVDNIRIEIENDDMTYYVCSASNTSYRNINDHTMDINILQYRDRENKSAFTKTIEATNNTDDMIEDAVNAVWSIMISGNSACNAKQLFLPASRAGLQMMYRYYFAEEIKGNLVLPIRDFLKFLQLYSYDEQMDCSKKDLLEFGQNYLLKGRIVQKGDETFFDEGQDGMMIPLYVAPSMIHELAPFMKAFSSTQQIGWLYCDEVENSLHPLLQGEMARWLIQMVNAGMCVLISSHSDTMASRLNNLFMLNYLGREKVNYAMLKELGLTEADLLGKDIKVSVYEFRTVQNGKTVAEELEFIGYPLIGYDFKLFGENLDKLYEEADRITR